MQDILLFNIGFRCEGVCEALHKYKTSGIRITQRTLDDSLEVIKDCCACEGSMTSFFSSNHAVLSELLPLVFDVFPNKEVGQIVEELIKIRDAIETVKRGVRGVDVDACYDFFKKISNLCLRRNARPKTTSLFPQAFML